MNVEIEAEAALFPEKEYINGIAVAVWTWPLSCFYPFMIVHAPKLSILPPSLELSRTLRPLPSKTSETVLSKQSSLFPSL